MILSIVGNERDGERTRDGTEGASRVAVPAYSNCGSARLLPQSGDFRVSWLLRSFFVHSPSDLVSKSAYYRHSPCLPHAALHLLHFTKHDRSLCVRLRLPAHILSEPRRPP